MNEIASLKEGIVSFIDRYYLEPIINDSGYNPVNTITWAILLGFFIILIHRAFRRYGVDLSWRLTLSTIPFIIAGSSLRVIEDARLVDPPLSYFLVTPLIYFLVASIAIVSLFLSRRLSGNYRLYYAIGLAWSGANIIFLSISGIPNAWVFLAVAGLGFTITGCVYILSRLNIITMSRQAFFVILAHMLDASSTYIGVDWFGYSEKHVVPSMLISAVGTAALMYPIKLLVLLPLLKLLDGSKDDDMKCLLFLVLLVLGLAPATRNTLRLALGI